MRPQSRGTLLILRALLVVLAVITINTISSSPILITTHRLSMSLTRLQVDKASKIDCCDSAKSTTEVNHYIFSHHQFQKNTTQIQRQLPSNNLFVANPWVNLDIVQNNAKFIPHDMKIHVYNDTSMILSAKLIDRELKQVANVTGAWEAFQLLRPWAFRADLWRYMILWSEGGIYLDGKMVLQAPVEQWAALAPEETISLCLDYVDSWNPTARQGERTPIFYQAVLSARRRSPILLEAIKMVIDNVNLRAYPSTKDGLPMWLPEMGNLAITGPILIGLAASKFPNSTYRQDLKFKPDQGIMLAEIFISRDHGEHVKVHRTGGGHYADLYKSRAIYCDSPASKNHSDCNLEALLQAS